MKRLVYLSCVVLVAGCGTPQYAKNVQQFSESGNCKAAFAEIQNNAREPGIRAALTGAVYGNCLNDRPKAIQYMTLSARYGNEGAREKLAELGYPVPRADLQSSSVGPLEVLNAAMAGYANSPTRSSRTVNCDTVRLGNTLSTSCN